MKVKSDLPNQTVILTSLALSELLFSISKAVFELLKLEYTGWRYWEANDIRSILYFCFLTVSRIANRLAMLYVICDRYLAILMHLRYEIFFPKTRVLKIVTLLWLVSTLYTAALVILTFIKKYLTSESAWNNMVYTGLTLDAIIVVLSIGTYVYFYIKVRAAVKSDAEKPRAKQKRPESECDKTTKSTTEAPKISPTLNGRSYKRKFLLPFLVVITYILFNISSMIAFQVRSINGRSEPHDRVLAQVGSVLMLVGYINDAVLYIFVQKNIRHFVFSLLPVCIQGQFMGNREYRDSSIATYSTR